MDGSIDGAARHMLWTRASGRCEYCQTPLGSSLYHLDHIVPRRRGGDDRPSNITVSCARCNINKSDRETGIDPWSWHDVALFNPRTMRWTDHFNRYDDEPVPLGKTPIGRATTHLLFRFTPSAGIPDAHWDKLADVKTEETYIWLNLLRFLRTQNRFEELDAELLRSPTINPVDAESVHSILGLVRLELRFTRSKPDDVRRGLIEGQRLIRATASPIWRAEFASALSVLFEQRASLRDRAGDSYLKSAHHWQQQSCVAEGNVRKPSVLIRQLRRLALSAKLGVQVSSKQIAELAERLSDFDLHTRCSAMRLLSDLALFGDDSLSRAERLLSDVQNLLQRSGYATGVGFAHNVGLRRRWWMLKLAVEDTVDFGLLAEDALFWRKIHMHHEIRAFDAYLNRFAVVSGARIADARAALRDHRRSQ